MRVLFDLVHPQHGLFFYRTIRALQSQGAEVCIASRKKDVLIDILDDFGLDHAPLTTGRKSMLGLAFELIERDIRLIGLARDFRPDVMAGFGGVAISHVGKLLGVPSVSFYDTEHAPLQLKLTLPFVTEWHVPSFWNGPEARGRTFRFAGSKQFAYFHPDHFRPDESLALSCGWDPARDNFLLRTVSWQANHDAGRRGISIDRLREFVGQFSRLGKVHISSEGELPTDLAKFEFKGKPLALHHLLAKCRLYCGESLTVAAEAAALGVPSLVQIDKDYASVADLQSAGLARRFGSEDDTYAVITEALSVPPSEYRKRAVAHAKRATDLNQYILDVLCRAARKPSSSALAAAPAAIAL